MSVPPKPPDEYSVRFTETRHGPHGTFQRHAGRRAPGPGGGDGAGQPHGRPEWPVGAEGLVPVATRRPLPMPGLSESHRRMECLAVATDVAAAGRCPR
jgi:hypothetical protein